MGRVDMTKTGVLRKCGNGHENVCHITDTGVHPSARATLTKPATRNSKTESVHVTTGTRKSLQFHSFAKHKTKWTDENVIRAYVTTKYQQTVTPTELHFIMPLPHTSPTKYFILVFPLPPPPQKNLCNFHVFKTLTTHGLPTWKLN